MTMETNNSSGDSKKNIEKNFEDVQKKDEKNSGASISQASQPGAAQQSGAGNSRTEAKNVLEAILFMSAKPLSVADLASIAGIGSVGYVKELLEELKAKYNNSSETAIEILNFEDTWQMSVKSKYLDKVRNLSKSELSRGATRVLAYVYQNQPVLQSEVVKTLGESAYSYIKELKEKNFIELKPKGRTKEIKTTTKFKQYFESA